MRKDVKNAKEEKDVRIRAVVSLILYLEVSRQRTHLIGTSLHPASRKTPAGSQRNAGIGHGEGGTQTPRTKDNDCDVGTYRQVRPTFPKRADLMTGTTVPIKEECPKTRRKKKTCVSGRLHLDWADGGIQATDAPNRYVPTSGIAENAGERSTECRDIHYLYIRQEAARQ